MEKITVTMLTHRELENLFNEAFGVSKPDWDSVAEFEWNNGCEYLIEDVKPEISEDFQLWLDDDHVFTPHLFEFMNALCERQVIAAGHYLIKVSW